MGGFITVYIIGVLLSYGIGLIDWIRLKQSIPKIWLFYGFLISLGSWITFVWMGYLFIKDRLDKKNG
jgi:uncharacterized transporter YbjL